MSSCCQTPCVWAESLQELWQSGAHSWRGPLEKFLFSIRVVTEPVSQGSYGVCVPVCRYIASSRSSYLEVINKWKVQQMWGSIDMTKRTRFFFPKTTGTIGELLTLWSFNIMGVLVTRWHAGPIFLFWLLFFLFEHCKWIMTDGNIN